MNKQLTILLFFTVIIFFFSCRKNFDYPLIQTGEVTDIDSTGAIFHGKIINLGEQEIIDYGFVWNMSGEPTIENSYKKSLGETNTDDLYSTEINSAFIEGSKYYVRAFIKNKKTVVYGRDVSFISLGSKAPKIISFSPDTATWGDTIIITGENFSNKNEDNKIEFGNFSAIPINSTDLEIITTVPYDLSLSSVNITVSVLENITISGNNFHLTPPEIIDFNPKSGTYQTTVEISGKYFHPNFTEVYFDTIEADIKSINFNTITAEVPSGLPPGEVDLSVIAATQEVISDIKFNSLSPDITGFTPTSGTFGDEITIQGYNFSNVISENTVKFGDFEATITQASENNLKVLVPNTLFYEKSKISITVKEQTDVSDEDFTLLPPIINNFSPKIGTFGDEITITGQNFNPIPSYNIVKFGDTIANVKTSSNNELKVFVPNNYYSVNGKTKISIEIGEISCISEDEFELLLHIIDDLSPNYGSREDTITIIGQNFNPVPEYNTVFFDNIEAEVCSAGLNALSVIVPSGFTHNSTPIIKVRIINKDVISSQNFTIYEPWYELINFPSNGRQAAVRFSINGKGYVGLGSESNDFWEYDPTTNQWTQKANCQFPGTGHTCFSTLTKCYFIDNKQLWQYDPVLDIWSRKTDFPSDATGGQFAFAVENKGYVGTGEYYEDNGGGWGEWVSTKELWEYDENTELWSRKTNFPGNITCYGTAFSIGNKGYFVFGKHYSNSSLWEYNTITDEWAYKLNLTGIIEGINNGRYWGVGMTINDKGYFGTGSYSYYNSKSAICNDFYEYDPTSNTCKKIVSMYNARTVAIGFSINNKGYIGLGWVKDKGSKTNLIDFWEFDPSKLKP